MLLRKMRNGFFSALFLGLLVLGGFSLVLSDWSGMFHNGGLQKTDVAVVNGEPIKINEFNTLVTRTLRNQRVNAEDAYKMGLIDNLLQGEVFSRVLDLSTADYGIVVEDKYVANQIKELIQPLKTDGVDDKTAFSRLLQSQGMNERYFTKLLRSEMQNNLLKNAVNSASYIPNDLAKDIVDYRNITKNIDYVTLFESDIKLPKQADDKTLEDYYKTIESQYKTPESRTAKLAIVDLASQLKDVAVSDDDIQAFYNENKDSFAVGESKTIEQALLKTEADAIAVKQLTSNGKSLKEAVNEKTGSASAFTGTLSIEKSDLDASMATPIFGAKDGDIVGPLKSPLGFHLFHVVGTKPAHTKDISEVRAEIQKELHDEKAGNQLFDLTSKFEDRLAAGEDYEGLTKDYKLTVIDLPDVNATATKIDTNGKIELDDKQTKDIVARIFSSAEQEPSTLSELNDTQYYSVTVSKVTASAPKPFAEVKDAIGKRWEAEQKSSANLKKAQELIEKLNDKKSKLADVGAVKTVRLTQKQDTATKKPEPFNDLRVIGRFMDSANGTFVLAIPTAPGSIVVGVVTSTKIDDDAQSADKEIENIKETLKADTATVNMMFLADHLQKRYPVQVNNNLLERIYGPKGEEQTQ